LDIIEETKWWMKEAEAQAEEAASFFLHARPESGARHMAQSIAIVQLALPLFILLGNDPKHMVAWIQQCEDRFVACDWVGLYDTLTHERSCIEDIAQALDQNPSLIHTLETLSLSSRPEPNSGGFRVLNVTAPSALTIPL